MGLAVAAPHILFSYRVCLLTALAALVVVITVPHLALHRHAARDFLAAVNFPQNNSAKEVPSESVIFMTI